MDNFQKSAVNPTGRLYICKACMSRRMAEGRKKKKAKQMAREDLGKLPEKSFEPFSAYSAYTKKTPEKVGAQAQAKKESMWLHIDFSSNPDLFERLKKMAAEELRTLENQAVYMLMQQEKKGPMPNVWA